MKNPDGLPGIAGDRKFISALYVYQKSKEELKKIDDEGKNKEKKEKTELVSLKYCLEALDHCFTRCAKSSDETKIHYLDYIRWNRDIIVTDLDCFKRIPHLNDFFPTITEYEDVCKEIIEKNFQLTTEDKAVVNQYVHAYERNEAQYLITRLKDVDVHLKKSVQEAFELFKDYREFDDGCAKTNDELIAKALKLAHSRATENVLQTALRNIKEAIVYIKHVMEERIAEAWEVGKLCLNPIRHPIETGKNVAYAARHPIETLTEIIRCAKKNPWKFGILMALGLVGVAGIVGAILVFSPLIAIPLSGMAATAIGCGFGAIGVGAALTTMAASGGAARAADEAERRIAIQEAKEAALIAKDKEEGKKIAEDVLDNYIRRKELRKAREKTEKAIRKQRLEKEKEEERKLQIASMTQQQLEEEEPRMQTAKEEIETNLLENEQKIKQYEEEIRQFSEDTEKINEGRNALGRCLEHLAKNNKPVDQEM
uniref:Uncharacterized protein n=1 Tax=Panagrolaimus sp. JU765 TaxID=591449 RepID=A0AC34RFA1_9BILA